MLAISLESNWWTPFRNVIFRWYRYTLRWVLRNYTKPAFVAGIGMTIVAAYIVFPTRPSDTRSTRIDKYTKGMLNTGNDCFANATLQALAALDQVVEYLTKFPRTTTPVPLHAALAMILRTLRQPVWTNESVSVWPFLRVLERVHGGRISRSQQDAHELMQLVMDTLETEHLRAVSAKYVAPSFPFSSVIESRMSCVRCGGTSVPVRRPMMMWEVTVPHASAPLEDVLQRSWNEVIEGYACVVCTVDHILLNRASVKMSSREEEALLVKLQGALAEGTLRINDDVSDDPVYKSLVAMNSNVLPVKTVVHRRVSFVTKPKVLAVHLSRSLYSHEQSWRNRTSIGIPETLVFGNTVYTLKSMVRHQGSHSAGHYECYRRKPMFGKKRMVNKPFWRVSDTRVTEVKTQSVLKDVEGAYLLLYEQTIST
ncbi:hypothetical protein CANINC_005022 [Pichia inconspicua]|uniref:Ubiquitin carboxyl-terminal hydrolase n=1 Tax=Pichia inconspicua TaxID=52247 RepID=A0A4T0WVR7_9ASCO|nr:hypothetical protein CANINC_005022 [[Candida] inconspicua]